MRTIQLRKPGGLDRLEVTQMQRNPPRRGEIVVRMGASSLNFHDYAVVTGMIPTPDGRIPMSDGAGEVIEIGEDGLACEYVTAPATSFTRAPHGYSDAEAATLTCAGLTA